MNVDKNELIQILIANTPRDWKESDVSDEMLGEFNKEYSTFLKVYPGYDPLATDEYRGKQDDDFLEVLIKAAKAGGQKLGLGNEGESKEVVGESLVQEGWPNAYGKTKKFTASVCEDALDLTYAAMSWEGVKSVMKKFPSRAVQIALNKNHDWNSYKNAIRPYMTKVAAFCLGPKLDGDLSCWSNYQDGPAVVRDMRISDLVDSETVVSSIMEALIKKYPMSPAVKAGMRHEVIPNLHMRVYEANFEMDAGEFADIAAALNSTAQNLAEIVHGFVSKAIAKARDVNGKDKNNDGGDDGNSATDENQELLACFEECTTGGSTTEEALAKCAAKFNISVDKVREILTAMNVNLGGAADTTAANNASAPAASNDPNAANAAGTSAPAKTEAAKKDEPDSNNPFALHVNKQYQTATGQVLTLRKMSGGNNPQLVFEDDNTGERVEMLRDKFLNMNPVEANIDSTKTRKSLINKFKRRINLSNMKHTARIIYKNKAGRKIYENLDSIKSGGKPVGDIAGVSIGNGKNQIEYSAGNKVKAGEIEGKIKAFKINENEEPEIIVKTPEGDEVTITVADFEEAEPTLQTEPLTTEPVEEHLEYKGYSLLQNAEDQTWSVMQGDVAQEGAVGLSEEDAKAWVDAKLEEEGGGEPATDDGGGVEDASEAISERFITESKDGSIRLKTFSQVLAETKIPALRKNLISTKKPAVGLKTTGKPAPATAKQPVKPAGKK